MSKSKKVIVSVLAILLVVILVSVLFLRSNNHFYYYFYTGDRVVINMHVNVDGKDKLVSVNSSDVKAEEKANYTVISIRHATYGPYVVETEVDGIPIRLNGYMYNSWDVQNINLYISIDTENKTVSSSEMYTYVSEEDGYTQKSVAEPEIQIDYTDSIDISVGTYDGEAFTE